MAKNSDFYRQIMLAVDDLPAELEPSELLTMAADWMSGAHLWQFLIRKVRLSLRPAFTITGATYTHATRAVTLLGAFADYDHVPGDAIDVSTATGADVPRMYEIASKLDDDTIILAEGGLGAGANGSADVAGRIRCDSIRLPTDFMSFHGARPLWSTDSIVQGVALTTREDIDSRRTSTVEVDSSWWFYGAVSEAIDRSTELSVPILEIYPPASAEKFDAFQGRYRARIVIDETDEDAIVPLPVGRPLLRAVLVKVCRAFALGLDQGEEVGNASVEEHLETLVRSQLWAAAKKQDGMQQSTPGTLRGGVGNMDRNANNYLATEVDAPS